MAVTSGPGDGLVARAHVLAVSDADGRSLERIREAVEACDAARATVLALARAVHGEDVPAELVARLLPLLHDGVTAARLMAIACGDRAAAWLAAARACAAVRGGAGVRCVAIYAAWRAGAPRAALIAETRRAARAVDSPGAPLLYTVARALDDPALNLAVQPLRWIGEHPVTCKLAAELDEILAAPVDEQLRALPEVVAPPVVSGFTVRVAPRVGRNEPCPCGSGQKFKRCCIDRQPQVAPSPVAGLSWDEYLTRAADRLSIADVRGLSLRDLARVEVRALGDRALIEATRRWTAAARWTRAEGALDELARRMGERADGYRDELVQDALEAGELEVARRQIAAMVDRAEAWSGELELAVRARAPGALEALASAADRAARKDSRGEETELAFALLHSLPALGILVARGCLHSCHRLDAETLCEHIEDARAELGLAPGDPAWDVYAELDAGDDEERSVEPATEPPPADGELRSALRESSARLDELERRLATTQRELEAARRTPAPAEPAAPAPDPDLQARERLRALKAKVGELEGMVRERNAERSELRRQLAAARRAAATAAPPRAVVDDEDAAGESLPPVARGVALPELSRRAEDALAAASVAVAGEALRTIGCLGAGDAAAWRGVKQARDVAPPLYLARIGIHHRLLFRVDGRHLEVLDLVTRESFDTTLKRLRA